MPYFVWRRVERLLNTGFFYIVYFLEFEEESNLKSLCIPQSNLNVTMLYYAGIFYAGLAGGDCILLGVREGAGYKLLRTGGGLLVTTKYRRIGTHTHVMLLITLLILCLV